MRVFFNKNPGKTSKINHRTKILHFEMPAFTLLLERKSPNCKELYIDLTLTSPETLHSLLILDS